MQTAPTNWATYFANIAHKKEYRVTISESDGTSPVTYGVDSIKAASIESALLATDRWIGNCISSKLTISMLKPVTVPRMAKLKVEVRLVLGAAYTDYVTVGYWWVDERESSTNWITLTCYDAMLITEQPFIDAELESGTWPITMTEAVTEICTRTGITLDARTTILTGTDYVVAYTNDLTMREVLENIATAHGGNWTITPEGKLRLVVLASAGATPAIALGQSVKNFYSADAITISKVTLYDDAENAFTAGDTTGYELSADCLYATDDIATALCNTTTGTLYGVVYTPFEAVKTYLNPLFELGDDLSVNGISSVIYTADISLTTAYTADISCPYEQEVDHEYPYLSEIKRANNRTVRLGTSYYGTRISRKEGIVNERIDGEGDVVGSLLLNADNINLKVLEDGTLKNKLYVAYDESAGKWKLMFDGELSASVITALSAIITPNLYAQKATIAEVTVDRLDTSDKVQKYLDTDVTDDNFQRLYDQFHEFITATTDGLEENKVQATNRDGDLLYWTDETHTAADTTERTGLEVWTFLYTETNKMRIGFRLDPGGSGYYVPMVELGAGTGSGDSGKGFMYKGTSGLYLDYYSSVDGSLRRIILGDDGIVLTPYGLNSIDFYDNGFSAVYDGETVSYNWTLNPDGTIATLVTEDMVTIPITWHAGDM